MRASGRAPGRTPGRALGAAVVSVERRSATLDISISHRFRMFSVPTGPHQAGTPENHVFINLAGNG